MYYDNIKLVYKNNEKKIRFIKCILYNCCFYLAITLYREYIKNEQNRLHLYKKKN